MPKKESAEAAVETTLESFDVAEWLSGKTNPKTSVTVYRDGEKLEDLKKLTNYALQMQSEQARAGALSIADEETVAKLDADTETQIEKLRAEMAESALTFHLTGFPQIEQDLITKKVAKSFKAKPATEDEEAVPGGDQHPDYPQAISDAYLARAIEKVVTPSGAEVTKKWTPKEVHALRDLPAQEFARLERAAISVVYMQYDVDQLIDQDFS